MQSTISDLPTMRVFRIGMSLKILIVLPATCGPDEEGANEEGVDDEEGLRRGGTLEEGFAEARRAVPTRRSPDEEATPDEESTRRGGHERSGK